jgi:hypothetical protein
MILRVIPILLILIPIIGFFWTPELPSSPATSVHALVYLLFTIPWWAKILSIIIGLIWGSLSFRSENEN